MLESSNDNKVNLVGKVASGFMYSHTIYGENFYTFSVEVLRLSGQKDIIPLLISNRLLDVTDCIVGKYVDIRGQFRSYNKHSDVSNKNSLVLYVFINSLKMLDVSDIGAVVTTNYVLIEGQLCREPHYRKTPLDKEVCDLIIAVNRPYKKADYVPCITWGRNAVYASKLSVSTSVYLSGRIQSREYLKKDADGNSTKKVAYEVSVFKISEKTV